jgi:hypothetical protein
MDSIGMEPIFKQVYESRLWGDNKNAGYTGSSGGGSTIDYNKDTYIPFLRGFIRDRGIKSIVDLGCGDFVCGPLLYDDLDITYTGYDAYKKVVEYNSSLYPSPKYSFFHQDISKPIDNLQSADLCILKDVLQHWSSSTITRCLDSLLERKLFKTILICNCCDQQDERDIQDGEWRALSSKLYPLKKYNPVELYRYNSKEVCSI